MTALAPALFVLLWSTGFVSAKLGLPYAEPFTFLAIRFAIASAVLVAVALATGAPWPKGRAEVRHLVTTGLLFHGIYLGGVFYAIAHGVPAGVSALITGLQPLLVALLAGQVLGERLGARAWVGLLLGFGGAAIVVSDKLGGAVGPAAGLATNVLALLGMTAGTLYQKRHGGRWDLRTGNALQFAAAGVAAALVALAAETRQVRWTGEFLFALGWSSIVLSLGAISLLFLLIRRGSAARVSSLVYMTPPVTALMAWPLFGETLSPVALVGMAAAVVGVALVQPGR